jgi:hypothetical protein
MFDNILSFIALLAVRGRSTFLALAHAQLAFAVTKIVSHVACLTNLASHIAFCGKWINTLFAGSCSEFIVSSNTFGGGDRQLKSDLGNR